MALYSDQFSPEHDSPSNAPATKSLVIASTGRSGSHMLGHALHRTGAFGYPLEYVNPTNFAQWQRVLATTGVEATLRELQRRRTSPNGVFGIKLHFSHLRQLGGIQRVGQLLPNARYVILTRRDLVRQAVSLAVARQTGVWISGMEPTKTDPQYDFDQIHDCLRELVLDNAAWRYTLEAAGLPYIEVSFDEVKDDLAGVVSRIATFTGIEVDPATLSAGHATKKQGSALNDQWVERFLNEYEDGQLVPPPGRSDLTAELETKREILDATKQKLAEANLANSELKASCKQLKHLERSLEKARRHPLRRWLLPKALR